MASSTFGQSFNTKVDGQVHAQPLVAKGPVIAVAETNNVVSIDGSSGAVRGRRNLGPSWTSAMLSLAASSQRASNGRAGVRLATDAIRVTAKTKDGGSPTTPNWYMHSLDRHHRRRAAGRSGQPPVNPVRPPGHRLLAAVTRTVGVRPPPAVEAAMGG